ncbi:hypothetical protein BJY01DRAFT_210429 [Aspergillus pseudoustus]|uniref:NACHT domain-containing protein n=1 Tax=Aspergillus pseudoustus TaxID=1810923 RepID=A0ABR4KC58_9EURO
MAEALAVIGVAANIAQFLEYGLKLVAAGKEAYDSKQGTTKAIRQIELVVEDIQNQSAEVLQSGSPWRLTSQRANPDELAIQKYARQCIDISKELINLLRKLTVRDDAQFRVLESGRVALRTLRKQSEVLDLKTRLEDLDRKLRERLRKLLNGKQHSAVVTEIRRLTKEHEQAHINSQLQLDSIKRDILALTAIAEDNESNEKLRGAELTSLTTKLVALVNEHERSKRQLKVIRSLHFTEIKARHSDIENAHEALHWLYDESRISFLPWLESGDGIYWINGLAGSGKSTLMKYASDSERTIEALKTWAGGLALYTASFYFWNQGLSKQKSQLGLFQSLLYQILKAAPHLVYAACDDHFDAESWDVDELKQAFDRLSQQTSLSAKFCFFIDGLDEYNGEEEDIIAVLTSLSKSVHVKICASSRPWPDFQSAFSHPNRTLIVQDFTLDDMKVYIRDRLEIHEKFQTLQHKDPRCREIIAKIAERAQGIWLWVYLVTRDLRRQLNHNEGYDTLLKTLESFPPKLDEYFRRIIEQRHPALREEMSQIFLITTDAVQPLPIVALTFLQPLVKDTNHAVNLPIEPMTAAEMSQVHEQWRPLLHNRCGDLLTVRTLDESAHLFAHRVDFLHRTVRDFLRDNYYGNLREGTQETFDAKQYLAHMMLILIKRLPIHNDFRGWINNIIGLVDELLYYSLEVERRSGEAQVALLDEMDHVISQYAKGERNHWTHARDSPRGPGLQDQYHEGGQCTFLALTVQAKLTKYVEAKLDGNANLIRKPGRPLLDYALRPRRVTPLGLPYHYHRNDDAAVDPQLVKLLLERSANPNQPVHLNDGQTVWGLFLASCFAKSLDASDTVRRTWYEAAEHLIEHGADAHWSTTTVKHGNVSAVLQAILNDAEAATLLRRMQEVEEEAGHGWGNWFKSWVRR